MKYRTSYGLEKVVPAVRPYVRKHWINTVGIQPARLVTYIPEWIAVLSDHFPPRDLQRILRHAHTRRDGAAALRAAAEAGEIAFIQETWL